MTLSFDDYQENAVKTAQYKNEVIEFLEKISVVEDYEVDQAILSLKLSYLIAGLTSETGEVADKYKKWFRNQNCHFATEEEKEENKKLVSKNDLLLEIGDVLWYAALLAYEIFGEKSFGLIAAKNNEKLLQRLEENKIKSSGDLLVDR